MDKKERKKDVFLSGKMIDLTVLTEQDVRETNYYDWFNDEHLCQKLQKHYYPNTEEAQLAFVKNLENDRGKIQLGIKEKKSRELVGVISLQGIDFINRNAEIAMVMAVEYDDARQMMFSLEATRLMLDHAFFTLNLHRVYAGSLAILKPWLDLLKAKFGFKDEGCFIEHVYKEGKYTDVYRVGLLRTDYEKHLGHKS